MALKQFTLSEISRHNENNDLWIIVHNKVYDVTKFLSEHPGGEEVLQEVAGQDGTEGFDDAGHSADAKEMMGQYLVGEVVESERKVEKKTSTTISDKKGCGQAVKKMLGCGKCVIVPIAIGLVATIIYRAYFRSH